MAEGDTPDRIEHGPRALVLAVEADRREEYERLLADAGLAPTLVEDAKAAEQAAAERLPDVLVLDRGMPGLVIFRLYSRLRGLPGGADVPIFFVGEPGDDTPTDRYLDASSTPNAVVERVGDYLGLPSIEAAAEPEPPALAESTHAPPAVAERGSTPPTPVPLTPVAIDHAASSVEAIRVPTESEAYRGPVEPDASRGSAAGLAEPAPEPAPAAPASSTSRLDVILLRLGLLFLLLGGAVLLLRPDTSTAPIAPPNLATATPFTPNTPAPSPSPAGSASEMGVGEVVGMDAGRSW